MSWHEAFAAISFAWRWGRLGSLGDAEDVEWCGDGIGGRGGGVGGRGDGGGSEEPSAGRSSTSGGRTSPLGAF